MRREKFLEKANGVPGRSASHDRSKKQEKELATRLGGHVTPGSGNKAIKGDVRVRKQVRLEAKTTKNKSFSVTLEMINKIEEAALPFDELPVLLVEFNDGNGKKLKEVAIVPTYVLESLGYLNE